MSTTETLHMADPEELKRELALGDPTAIQATPETDPELDKQADSLVSRLVSIDPSKSDEAEAGKAAVENMGMALQEQSSHRSDMLKDPIRKMGTRTDDGGPVATALVDLKVQVEELDPGNFDLEAGWFTRLLGRLPGVGTPIKRYFTKFESSQTVIDAIIRSLEDGKEQLERDNVTLLQDQKFMREMTRKLQKAVKLGQLIDQKLSYAIERDLASQPERARFAQEELLFPLRQRIMDLQQQLAVNQQGVVTLEVVMRNNKELIRGVNRAKHVTVNALQVAVTLALALANQKIVLDKVNAVNKTTSDLIANTASRLRQQGAEIHKQSASTALDMEKLKAAFRDIHAALDDISDFRQKALPKMKDTIGEMEQLTDEGEKKIRQMERADVAAKDVFEIIPDDENW